MLHTPIRYINNGEPLDQVTLNRYMYDTQENLEALFVSLSGIGGDDGSVPEIPVTLALRDSYGTTQFAPPRVGTNPIRLDDTSVPPIPNTVVMRDSEGKIEFGGDASDPEVPVFNGSITGMVAFFAMATAPDGWLVADGRAVGRATYAQLFSRIGTLYGAGNGTTTFNLPDLRGEFPRGWDAGRGVDVGRQMGSFQGQRTNNMGRWEMTGGGRSLSTGRNIPEDGSWSGWGNKAGAGHTDAQRFRNRGGETRPRNVALLGCIKT